MALEPNLNSPTPDVQMNEINLRDYQHEAIDALRDGYKAGHRCQILGSPTGSGKTIMSAYLLDQVYQKGNKAAFVVDRVSLVDQTSAVLDRYGIDHGVVQAQHWRWRPHENIQVCSAQTIEKRGFFPDMSLLVVDECHAVRKATKELIVARKDLRVLGLSATPFTKGLGEIYTNLVNVRTTNQLVADGHLVPVKMYAAVAPDMTGAKIVAGEWTDKEVEQRGTKIVGDIVSEWVAKTHEHFGRPVKTIVFSATVAHGEELCRQFNAAGYSFHQISYKDGDDEHRKELIDEFRKPDSSIHGLVSCEVFTKGFDVPDILIGISARPYRKSLSSHIQQLGRVMRTSPGKEYAVWICHSGNVIRFNEETQEIFENGLTELDDGKLLDKAPRKEPTKEEVNEIKCGGCGYVMPKSADFCPMCGKERARRKSMVEVESGQLVEVGKGAKQEKTFLQDKESVWRQICGLALWRKHGDHEAAERFAKAQYRNIYGTWPRHAMRNIVPENCSVEVERLVTANLIRWAKSNIAKKAW